MPALYGKPTSINVRKVLWLCAGLDLPLHHEPAPPPDLLATLNPNRQVPVLRDGDFVLWESNSICRYLAVRAGRDDLLPGTAQGRARVEQWMDWQASDLNSAWRHVFMARVRRHPDYPDDTRAEASLAQWNRLMAVLDAQLAATNGYVAGNAFTLADVVLGLSAQRWRSTPGSKPALPHLAAWFERLRQQPGFTTHVDNGVA
ncbi:glutathione S-transferase family protein [Stenotrophomonas maltophilia]|uniref:glutathione S-transferase family protein n=1 Tax=Stenotrophomonas maltophilia TaxID=40324 RepID=UPI00066B70A8|nr:glutathione S-transferase N-terminal domain-containing protein [Stenotrophomonas maltophilia]MDT3430313.1 glutathione S-transferase N-terminal domain-containing protein [Stenotrophomonas maltophilia]PJL76074.1 glutathione S-transferase [Stenotrophomonas maltophilia]PZT03363.1 glutathione S-transferase [Stenotrophomonas maltophilia]